LRGPYGPSAGSQLATGCSAGAAASSCPVRVRGSSTATSAAISAAPANIQSSGGQVDRQLCGEDAADKSERLHQCVQSIAYRLVGLEVAVEQASSCLPGHETLASLGRQVQEVVRDVFQQWAKPDADTDSAPQRDTLERVSRELQQHLETLAAESHHGAISDQALNELYTVVGCVRSLIDAMTSTQSAMQQINWTQLSTPRF